MNTLTGEAGIKIGPIVLETLVKHYFERVKNNASLNNGSTQLRQDELLYDEAFNIVKVCRPLFYPFAFGPNVIQPFPGIPRGFHKVRTLLYTNPLGFLTLCFRHSVEELQRFSNMKTPSPPWVHVVKEYVPISCCDQAATYLIQALGGEEMTKRLVGGTKWWQVRGVKG